jgi:hypothetical protein
MGRTADKGIEWVSKSEFARRKNVQPPSIQYAIEQEWIFATPRDGKILINWNTESVRYEKYRRESKKNPNLKKNLPVQTPDEEKEPPKESEDEFGFGQALGELAENSTTADAEKQTKVYKARMAKLEWGVMAGKLIPLKDAQLGVAAMAQTTKKALRAIPDRLSARLTAATDEFTVREMLRKEIDYALENLKYEPKSQEE